MAEAFQGMNAYENVQNAMKLLPTYLQNHMKGVINGSDGSGITPLQRDLINASIGRINADQVKANPILEGLGDRRSQRKAYAPAVWIVLEMLFGESQDYLHSKVQSNRTKYRCMPRRLPRHTAHLCSRARSTLRQIQNIGHRYWRGCSSLWAWALLCGEEGSGGLLSEDIKRL